MLNFKIPKPMTIILIGGIISVIGGAVAVFGTYLHNKSSSSKSDTILGNTEKGVELGETTVDGVTNLISENKELKGEVSGLKAKQTELLDSQKSLNSKLEPFIKYATELYPHLSQKEALEKLRLKLENVSTELKIEKNTIKTFDVKAYIKFSGKWSENPYPHWLQPGKPTAYITWIDTNGKLPNIEFISSRIGFTTVNESTAAFDNVLIVEPGSYSMGKQIDFLNGYNFMRVSIPFTHAKALLSSTITVTKVEIVFSINGTKKYAIYWDEPMVTDISKSISENGDFASFDLKAEGTLTEIFKLK